MKLWLLYGSIGLWMFMVLYCLIVIMINTRNCCEALVALLRKR
jgi:hypothetical protein